MVTSRRRGPAPEDLALAALGAHRRVRLRCRSHVAALRAVEQTDLVLTMTRRYAVPLTATTDTRFHKVPFAMPTLDGYLYWHDTMHDDPANRWLRAELLEAVQRG